MFPVRLSPIFTFVPIAVDYAITIPRETFLLELKNSGVFFKSYNKLLHLFKASNMKNF